LEIVTLPLLAMVNLVAPDLLAVKRSPVPELSTSMAAKELRAEMEAVGTVPIFPLTSSLANGVVVPIPILPDPEKVRLYPAKGISVAAVNAPPSLTALTVLVRPLLKVNGYS
jgi:hypothetical protein